jgi:hypothetical protein
MLEDLGLQTFELMPWYSETRSRFGSESYADRLNDGQAATLIGH